jgi:hypothetical protein
MVLHLAPNPDHDRIDEEFRQEREERVSVLHQPRVLFPHVDEALEQRPSKEESAKVALDHVHPPPPFLDALPSRASARSLYGRRTRLQAALSATPILARRRRGAHDSSVAAARHGAAA